MGIEIDRPRFTGVDAYETIDVFIEELGQTLPQAFVQPGVEIPPHLHIHYVPTNGTYH